MPRGRQKGWAERGEAGGRPKGSVKPADEHKVYKNFTVSCLPNEYEKIKALALQEGKTLSRYLVDLALNN